MNEFWELKVRESFSAAHALRHYEGKCERTHGHNFIVEVGVIGRELDQRSGILLDFKVLKTILKAVLADMDHVFLNEQPPFTEINPSSENMARHIWQAMERGLSAHPDPQAAKVSLAWVSVSEKEGQTAIYRQKEGDI